MPKLKRVGPSSPNGKFTKADLIEIKKSYYKSNKELEILREQGIYTPDKMKKSRPGSWKIKKHI